MKWSGGVRFGEGEGLVIVNPVANGAEYTLVLDFTITAMPTYGVHENEGYGALVNWRTTANGVIWVYNKAPQLGAMAYNGDSMQGGAFKVGRQHLTVQKFSNGNVMFTIDAGEVETITDPQGNFTIGSELWLFKPADDPSEFVTGICHSWAIYEGA